MAGRAGRGKLTGRRRAGGGSGDEGPRRAQPRKLRRESGAVPVGLVGAGRAPRRRGGGARRGGGRDAAALRMGLLLTEAPWPPLLLLLTIGLAATLAPQAHGLGTKTKINPRIVQTRYFSAWASIGAERITLYDKIIC